MHHLKLVYSAPRATDRDNGFTSRDLIALDQWGRRADAHGYRRVLVEDSSYEGGPEEGAYVLLYAPDNAWARWGVVRVGDGVVVWHCGTGADLGSFDTMIEALESLPPVRQEEVRTRAKPPAIRPRFALVHSA